MRVIDFHTHAFPDSIARKAMPALEEEGDVKAALDGTLASLLGSMKRAGIERSVLASIATKPDQFEAILGWSRQIASEAIIPFPSVHPLDPDAVAHVEQIHAEGFRGVKLHPYYQGFVLDDERMFPIYEAMARCGLVLLVHTGYDMAFPRDRIADPVRTLQVLERVPGLKLVTTHLGAWEDWDAVRTHLLGKPIYMDVSFSFHLMSRDEAHGLLTEHPQEYLIFGSDSPWAAQGEAIQAILDMELGAEREACLFYKNGERLLGLDG